MSVFGDYARYYNLLYQDKNYAEEAIFILNILKKYHNNPKTLLYLGCGTGRHGFELVKLGLVVDGVDMSETMLKMGMENSDIKNILGNGLNLHNGDVRKVRLGKNFDVVTSLFHVMSYQNTDEDVLALLETANKHLDDNGVFLFDFWYSPAVFGIRPEHRIKVMEDDKIRVKREATPIIDDEKHIVTVHYDVELFDKALNKTTTFSEDHPMRSFEISEMQKFVDQVGMKMLSFGGWMKLESPKDDDWAAWVLVGKN